MNATGTLLLRRPRQYADICRRYRVFANGEPLATIARGEELRLELPAGDYTLAARIDWCGSNRLGVTIRPGATTEVEVGSNLTGIRLLAALFYITAGRGEYLYLRQPPRGFAVDRPRPHVNT
jgi:hypothetical protein